MHELRRGREARLFMFVFGKRFAGAYPQQPRTGKARAQWNLRNHLDLVDLDRTR